MGFCSCCIFKTFLSPGEVKTETGVEVETKELERKEIVCYWTCYL